MASTFDVSPRAGFAYDLTGDNRTVLKGYYGRFYFNSADEVANRENPVGSVRLRYQFLDLNGNRLLDGPQELGAFRSTQGTAAIEVDDNIKRPYSQELSTHLEREIVSGLSGRVSYVYKSVRDEWVEIDPTRLAAMTIPFPFTDMGADNQLGTSDDQTVEPGGSSGSDTSDAVVHEPNRSRLTRATSRRWSSLSIAASLDAGWC